MKSKILQGILVIISLFILVGCDKKSDNKYAIEFKEEYEMLNGKKNKSGKEHRTLSIDENNPYIKTTPEEIVKMINNKETFFLYVGDSLCPWCRSAIEKSIEVAKKYNIEKIYYIDIWDDDGNEILRDKYEFKDNVLTKVYAGTEAYKDLLDKLSSVLSSYTLTDPNGKSVDVGEKRIYAPNYFYIKNGEAVKMIKGYSSLQKDSREKLTDEMLKDEEKQFESLYLLDATCVTNEGC